MKGGEVLFNFKGDSADLEKKTSTLTSKLGSMGSAIGGAFVKGTAVVGTALTAMVGASVNAYADMEQNIGGVETLFKDSADKVIQNANNAFKTAGISANQYMEQVTSYSASLLQSLGGDTEKATKVADMAIIDMADNANKMGTDMSMIQSAYQGFAKGQYQLLDNLKLGYGGTKTEMERLLVDAEKISGVHYDIDNLSDVYNAIHVIQGELGITGTTAKEATETISGSVASAKSAFQNFLSGAGGIEDVISTFVTAGTNIGNAVIEMAPQIVEGLVQLINALIPQIVPMIDKLLPVVLSGVQTLFEGLVQAFPQIITILINLLPQLVTFITQMLPQILQALIQGAILIVQGLAEQMPVLIPQIIDAILAMIPVLIDNLPLFIKAGAQLIVGIVQGLIQSAPKIITQLKNMVVSWLGYMKQIPGMFLDIGKNLITGLWNGIKNNFDWVINKIKGLGSSIIKAVKGIFGIHSPSKEFAYIGTMNMQGLINGMDEMQPEVQEMIDGAFDLSPSLYGTTSANLSPNVTVINNVNMKQDPLGQMVNDIKTFSGGAKNDYNYGGTGA